MVSGGLPSNAQISRQGPSKPKDVQELGGQVGPTSSTFLNRGKHRSSPKRAVSPTGGFGCPDIAIKQVRG